MPLQCECKMRRQSTNTVVMIRPHKFTPNPETTLDNYFQDETAMAIVKSEEVCKQAYSEVTKAAEILEQNNINVHLFEDRGDLNTPDSVFPNNWFSTHGQKRMALYPMFAVSRRNERRQDIITTIVEKNTITEVKDYSRYEEKNLYLEGTGAMVLDRINRVAYVARSRRSNETVLLEFCKDFDYRPALFDSVDKKGIPIYHTNVMMGVGTGYAVICMESLKTKQDKAVIVDSFARSGHKIIDISIDQMARFAGNVLELDNGHEKLLAMSETAYNNLNEAQLLSIKKHVRIIRFKIPTIEMAGGSIRCMLCELFL